MMKNWYLTSQGWATFHQYLTTIIGSLSFAIVGSATGWPSPTLIKMRNGEAPVILDSEQISWMVSLMYLGHLTSPLPSGMLMDALGRKRAILLLAILPLISWLLIWSTACIYSLYFARFIAGLWAGAVATIVPIYIGEIADSQLRGSLTVFNHLMKNFGVLLVYIVGPYVSYYNLALSCMLFTLFYIITFSFMPESPYYLVITNKEKEAYQTLRWLRDGETVENQLEEIKSAMKNQMQKKGSFKDVWYNKGNRKAIIITEVYAVTKTLTGSGVLQAYTSITLPSLTFGMFSPDDCVMVLGLISLFSAAASVYLSVHLSRRSLITYSSTGCAVTMALVSVWFYLSSHTDINVSPYSDWLFICHIVYKTTFSLGLGPVGSSVKGELFPANVKAICSSLTTILVAVTSFLLNKFFLVIADHFGMHINFFIYAVSCLFTIVFTWVYVPETKGKSLEEIQRLLQGDKEHSK